MDLSGKTFHSAQSFLQNASSLVSAYGLGSPFITGQALTTSLYSGTSQALSNSIYSGSLSTSLSPSHASFSNGHSTTSPSSKLPDGKKSYASPAPVFNRHKDSFPYGISGVPMPNYGYQGDVYQFTSNGYPRKSRTCSYCGKVFTRSTTRRYHEKRCPLLRAAVSSYMGDDNSGSSLQSRVRGAELTSHSYTGQGQTLAPSLSGMGRSNDPQELATSVLKSPPVSEKRVSGDLLSGYQTSVIVKQEPHESEGSVMSSYSDRKQSLAQESTENRLRFSPDSAGSGHKLEPSLNLSPGYASGMDLTKSPSHTSVGLKDGEQVTSVLHNDYIREHYKVQSDSELDMNRGQLPSISSLRRQEMLSRPPHVGYKIDLTAENDSNDAVDNRMEVPDVLGDSHIVERNKDEFGNVESGEINELADKEHKVIGSHKCGICGKCFESSGKLHLHEQIHTKFRPYCCKFCGQRFAKSALRIAHEKTHNGVDTTHICAVCGSSFTRKYSLKLHMRRWHQEGPWLCRHCGKASLTQMELKTHLYSHNLPRMERESLLYMPDVPLNYGAAKDVDIDGQDTSMQDYNGDPGGGTEADGIDVMSQQEMEMCTECGRDFPKGYMRYHLKSHEAQKPYSCPICAKRFGYKNNMKSHIKLHTGVKPFCCKVCGAKFTRGSTLRRHARRHGIIADSVWDLFVKSNYGTGSKSAQGNKSLSGGKLETITTSNGTEGIATITSSSSTQLGHGNVVGDTNYLDSTISPTSSHSTRASLYHHPLYASLGQIAPRGLYSSLSSSTSYLQHLPHTMGYSASSHTPPQQLDALNLSLQKAPDQNSDQSSFSNMSAERSRSRSRSLSGSENHRRLYSASGKFGVRDVGVQVHTCCKSRNEETSLETSTMPSEPPSGPEPSTSSTTPVPKSPQNMAVMPYIVTSPTQRPSNVDSASPALSVSSVKDYSLETISSLISSGRMFKCFHCECYFSEYAMYRIHSKLHLQDFTRPFVCLVCGEDCYDRVYFALHLSEHLR